MSLNQSCSHQILENGETIEEACGVENELSQNLGLAPTLHDEQEVNNSYPDVTGSHPWASDSAVTHHDLPESHYNSDVSVQTNSDDGEFDSSVDSPDLRHSVEWEVDADDGSETTSRPPKRRRVDASSSSRLSREDVEDMVRRRVPPDPSWPVYRVRILKSSDDWDEIKRWQQHYNELKRRGQRLEAEDDGPAIQATCRYPTSPWSLSEEATSTPVGSVSPAPPPPSSTPCRGTPGTPTSPLPGPSGDPGPAPSHGGEDVSTQLTALRQQLEIVHANQALMLTEIGILKSQLHVAEVRESRGELPQGYSFPINTQEELQDLDEALADDAVCRRFERYIVSLGGDTFRALIKNAGKALMTPSLQGQYNLRGRNNKTPFRLLANLHTALYNAVSGRHEVDMKTFDTYLGEWLAQWRDRQQGRRKGGMEMQDQTERTAVCLGGT